ncbi:protein kinase [Perkinsus chesapeaki]|uniref:Protein kinase n=1 Tax=Perkinsus chesapeaki TaxID=330153 RepID=A0A7J6N035_PERCH|nr:protein kinase [Perkinsus chesapeaki]
MAMAVVVFVTLWNPNYAREDVHRTKLKKYNMHISSLIKDSNLTLPVHKNPRALDVKVVTSKDTNTLWSHLEEATLIDELPEESGRTLNWQLWYDPALELPASNKRALLEGPTTETLLYSNSLALATNVEAEFYQNVDLVPIYKDYGIPTDQDTIPLKFVIWLEGDGLPISFFFEALPLGNVARYRVLIAGILFVCTFALIITEKMHRVYATFIGSMLGLFLIALLHEVPELMDIMAMVDFGTLMLLFSMMVNVHLLALTGFFQYIAARMVIYAKGRVSLLFFLLTISSGLLSGFLDNVTTVMLIGPVTISLCKEIKKSPVAFYLAETFLATMGGATTLIGDPSNIIIGSKLGISFTDFLVYNAPLVLILLPIAAFILYTRFKSEVSGMVELDIEKMKRENIIHDKVAFAHVASLFAAIVLALCLSPVHGFEPAWFTLMSMYIGCMITSPHDFHKVLEAVEWDTLIFFASLFVFVESINELGLIRAIGDVLTNIITSVPIEHRLWVAQLLILWVSAIGSAFLESLPYADADEDEAKAEADKAEDDEKSVHSVTRGDGVQLVHHSAINRSLFGEDDNLMPVSPGGDEEHPPQPAVKRHPIAEARAVEAKHFLQYGFPLLMCLMVICSLYQVILFEFIGAANDMPA